MPPRNSPRDLRASDADRDRVIALLAEAVADGRLTAEEHAQRVESAHSARTLGELAVLTRDLVTAEAQPLQLDGTRPVAAVFGDQRREGRWVVPDRLAVAAVFGEALLDFRAALLQGPRVIIYATVIVGRLTLLVPEGITVEVTASSLASRQRGIMPPGTDSMPAAGPGRGVTTPRPGAPGQAVIEVRGLVMAGRVQARTPDRARRLRIFPRRGR